jgi:uncharacterized protein YndB with AHSA1/START domain
MTLQQAQIAQISMEIQIAARPAEVWKALTDHIGRWWPVEFFAGGEDGKRRYICEAKPGGRMFEQWDNGGGVLWGTVVCCDPGSLLQVLGVTFPNWGGPAQSYNTWELKGLGEGTMLTFSESTLGRVSDPNLAEKDKGWRFLWETLKAHLEQTPFPKWQD